MFHKYAPLRQLTRKIVRQHVDLNLEVLCDRILDVLVQLSVFVKELELVRAEWLLNRSRFCWVATDNFLHTHQYFIDAGYILLNLSYIVLQNGKLDALCGLQPRHNGSILIAYILINNALDRLDFVEAMVKSYYLTNKLRALRHE